MFLWLPLAACRPDDIVMLGPELNLVVSPTELALGPTPIQGRMVGEVVAWNDGDADVHFTVDVVGEGFTVMGNHWTAGPAEQAVLEVVYEPPDIQDNSGMMYLLTASGHTMEVTLDGTVTHDADQDGFDHTLVGGPDCEDSDPSIHPDAPEVWYDGVDQDCDGNDTDQDGDGAASTYDCDDTDPDRYPEAVEVLDGIDNDCDAITDEVAKQGALVVTELYLAPTDVPPLYGQYIEVYNTTDLAIGIGGWALQSSTSTGVVHEGVAVEPGAAVVLCGQSDVNLNGGIPCDHQVTPWPLFSPSLDAVALEAEVTIDEVAWDNAWTLAPNEALVLDAEEHNHVANDALSNWCVTEELWGDRSTGSPGAANPVCVVQE